MRSTQTSRSDGRGVSGIAIIWRHDLDVAVVHAPTSDHICSIRLTRHSSRSTLTVIGVYLPCQDLGNDLYRSCLIDLEQLVYESKQLAPLFWGTSMHACLALEVQKEVESQTPRESYFNDILSKVTFLLPHCLKWQMVPLTPTRMVTPEPPLTASCLILVQLLVSWGTLLDNDLNTSDHLPQSVSLEFDCKPNDSPDLNPIKIDWSNVESSCTLYAYQSEISALVTPYLDRCYENIYCLNEELELVAESIKNIAMATLPNIQPQKKRKKSQYYKDSTLKFLCDRSKSIWQEWCKAGRPQSGPLFASKKDLRREIKKRIHHCAAVDERKHVRKREILFKRKDTRCFKAPHKMKSQYSKLRVKDELLSDKDDNAWVNHFSTLSKRCLPSEERLQQLHKKMDNLLMHLSQIRNSSLGCTLYLGGDCLCCEETEVQEGL